MRIILSKKGFDTKYGGYPSVVNEDAFISMPIPESSEIFRYNDLHMENGASLYETIKPYYSHIYIDNKRQPFTSDLKCHPDPNLTNYFNRENFLGSIGQVDNAQAHLHNQGITIGDIFLFYGWFKEKNGKDKQTIFGYLQVGSIITTHGLADDERKALESQYPWLKDQPHWINPFYINNKTNTIYVASERLSIEPNLKGYGTFSYSSMLDLTKPNAGTMSEWFLPDLSGLTISHNSGKKVAADGTFKVVARFGQEFVIEKSNIATNWVENLIKNHAKR